MQTDVGAHTPGVLRRSDSDFRLLPETTFCGPSFRGHPMQGQSWHEEQKHDNYPQLHKRKGTLIRPALFRLL